MQFLLFREQEMSLALKERLLEEGLYGNVEWRKAPYTLSEMPKWRYYWIYMKDLFKNMTASKR